MIIIVELTLVNCMKCSDDLKTNCKTVDDPLQDSQILSFSYMCSTLVEEAGRLYVRCGSGLKAAHTIAHLLCHCDMNKVLWMRDMIVLTCHLFFLMISYLK